MKNLLKIGVQVYKVAVELDIDSLKSRVLELWRRVMLSKRQENVFVDADLGLQMRMKSVEEVKMEGFNKAFESIIENLTKNDVVGSLRSCLDDNSDILDSISFSPYMRILRNVIGLSRKKKLTNITKKNTKDLFELLRQLFPAALVDKEDTIFVERRESIATGKFDFQ